uniref:Uncharacterized protein n=2 Tax=Lutzomyia longipalpis TaxID=7200 RepID=A0A1B0CTT1_LUTLO
MYSKVYLSAVAFLLAICVGCGAKVEIPEELREGARLLHEHCVAQTNVDESLILASVNGYLPDDRTLQCYIDCLFRTTGLIDENGHILFEEIAHLLPTEIKEIIVAVTSKCRTIHGKDECETAYLTVKCYFEADPEHSMLI